MNAESEMATSDGLGGEPPTPSRTRDDIREEMEALGREEIGEPGKLTWEQYDERKADLLEEAFEAPDRDTLKLSPQAQAVVAGFLDDDVENEEVFAAEEVWAEVRAMFPAIVYHRSLDDEGQIA